MKRTQRLEAVGKLINQTEQDWALRLSGAQARLDDAERRAQELRRYLQEYQDGFKQRATGGMAVSGIRSYQMFIARIGEALRQQEGIVAQLRTDWERVCVSWRQAATRKSGVGRVLYKARCEDRLLEERRVQLEIDERAQRVRGAR